MPIWHLEIIDIIKAAEHWRPTSGDFFGEWQDAHGFVIVAPTEAKAREMAQVAGEISIWLDPGFTACRQIVDDGEQVVLGNWPTG